MDGERVGREMGRAANIGQVLGGRRRPHHSARPGAAATTDDGRHPDPTDDDVGDPTRASYDATQKVGLTTMRKTMTTTIRPRNIPPRWIFLTVATTSGGGGPGGVPGGGGVAHSSIR